MCSAIFLGLVASSLVPTSLALPWPQRIQSRQNITDGSHFLIHQYDPGCDGDPAGCFYKFNLTITKGPNFLLATHCAGDDIWGSDADACETTANVTTHEYATSDEYFTLQVNYTFAVGDTVYKDVGNVKVYDTEMKGQSFGVVPVTMVVGVVGGG